ncbi:MAG: PEP-CTERM sorting domain-containing protein [Phycisphaerales bacterium JB037]
MKRTAFALTTVLLAGAAHAQPSATDLGLLTGDFSTVISIDPNEVRWFRFEVGQGATLGSGLYLDATTSSTATSIDTEIGLYDALGNRVANDDDNGIGLSSTLSFGDGSGMMLGDSFNLGGDGLANGENGDLPAGVYYLAVGEFNVDFNDTNWDVVSTGTDTGGSIEVSIFTNTPAPGSLALLGLGGLAATRRRRA